nr:reverse transcriptase domain, reverse transcriptase zinc-binding domain protein [Tanacetum cinerariifolium]
MVSGLVPSKEYGLICNVVHHVKLAFLNIMSFSEGELLVKYLGVPLISSRLLNKDCKILVEKSKNRIGDWKNKLYSLSPFNCFLTPRDISRECFSISTSVAELVSNGSWSWPRPQSWLPKASDLGLITHHVLDLSRDDVRQWCDNTGSFLAFSVAKAWEVLRPRGNQ